MPSQFGTPHETGNGHGKPRDTAKVGDEGDAGMKQPEGMGRVGSEFGNPLTTPGGIDPAPSFMPVNPMPRSTTGNFAQSSTPTHTQPTLYQALLSTNTDQSVRVLPPGLVQRQVHTTYMHLPADHLAYIVYDIASRNEYPAELLRDVYNPFRVVGDRLFVKDVEKIIAEIRAVPSSVWWRQMLVNWAKGRWP